MDTKKQGKKEEPVKEKHEEVKEVEHLKQERDDFKNKYLRALADYQNSERRNVAMRDEQARIAKSQLLMRIVPFLDNLDTAGVFIKDASLKMIRDQFHQTLVEFGLEEIDVLNKEYDPHLAEAIEVVKGEKDNIVVEVVQKGYRFENRILRPARVKVSKLTI